MAGRRGVLPDRYAEPRLIGHGGMGEIYLARDRDLGRQVAIKLLAERFAEDAELRERFTREALMAARLSTHAHVVTIFDVGEFQSRPYIVMEYLAGGTLAERAAEGPIPAGRALAWLAQAADALDAAHAEGIVHRDVKPANLLLDERGEVHVADFGVARVLDETTSGLTAAGTVLGTAGYISPEQAQGEPATTASDLYSLGIVAFELLTGSRPFQRSSATAEAAAHIHEPVPRASERGAGLPPAVDHVFEQALAKEPARRFRNAGAFVAALRSALEGEATARTRALPAAAAPRSRRRSAMPALLFGALLAALLAGGVIAGLLLTDGDDGSPATPPAPVTVTRAETRTQEGTTVLETETVVTTVPGSPSGEEGEEGDGEGSGGGGSDLSPEQAAVLNDQAFSEHMEQGDYPGALPLLEQAVPVLRGTYDEDFPYEAYAEYNLGKTLAELDRCKEALRHLRRSERLQGERGPITQAQEQCRA
jgi:eukaryotic-like serine/threonine-protein kinase